MSAPVRVVQVVNGLEVAGAEHTVVEIARSLPPEEFAVSLLVVRDGPLRSELEGAGIPIHVVGGGFDARWPVVVERMRRELRDSAPLVVHTHLIGSDIVGGLAARLAGVPVIISTQHDAIRRPFVYDVFRRTSSRWLSAVVPVAPSMIEYCTQQLHMPVERIHPIENGIDIAPFPVRPSPRHDPLTFGCVGRLVPLKGHEVVVRALALVRAALPEARLLVAGGGPEMGHLVRLTADLGLSGAVDFRGAVEDVPAFLEETDIMVHPSLEEGLPLAVLEAMAASKPLVASDLPAIRHALDDGRCGRLSAPGDVAALAAEMLALASDPDSAGALAGRARDRVAERYSLARMAGDYAALYRLLLARAALPVRASGAGAEVPS